MPITVSKELRAYAKAEKVTMFNLKLDYQYCEDSVGALEFGGTMPKECADKLLDQMKQWLKEGKFDK